MTTDQIWANLPGRMDNAIALGVQQIAVAQKVALRVERNQRIYDIYKQFIAACRIGDRLNLFSSTGNIRQYGARGLSDYPGQYSSRTPKLKAFRDLLGGGNAHSGPVRQASLKMRADSSATLANGRCPASTQSRSATPVTSH
jgi:hypothetical protein